MPEGLTGSTTRNAVVFIAVIGGGAALWWLHGILAPLALALFVLVLIDAFARALHRVLPGLSPKAATPVAFVILLIAFGLSVYFLINNVAGFIGQLVDYGPRLNTKLAHLAAHFGVQTPPTIAQAFGALNPARYMGSAAQSVQDILSDAIFVLIYLGFLIASRHGFGRKIITLFPTHARRDRAIHIMNHIGRGVERYVWVQTVTGLIIAAAAWAMMAAIGLKSALFWALFIFVAAYIPMVGAAVSIVTPAVFALVQFDGWWPAALLLIGGELIFFVVGNVILPKMQGDSLNLDPVVILLSLAFWGAIWGLPGAFLSSPLTVVAMIILAQFPSSRWIAVLLSENGDPDSTGPVATSRKPATRKVKTP